jgi:NADH dehydrogenase
VKLPSPKTYAFWLALLRIYAGAFWLIHGVPKFTQSDQFMPPNGFIVNLVNDGVTKLTGPYQQFLAHTVQPNISLFAELVRLGEVVTGCLLLLGFFTRLGGFLGMFLAFNYLCAKGGLDHLSTWAGTDALTIVFSSVHFFLPTGRMLGVDGLLGRRPRHPAMTMQPAPTPVQAEFVEEKPMTGPTAPHE